MDASFLPDLPILRLWVRSLRWLLLCLTLFLLRFAACMCTLLTYFLSLRVLLLLLLLLGLSLQVYLWLLLLLLIFLSSWFGFLVCALLFLLLAIALPRLASGRPASSILPQCVSQYAVHGDFSSSPTVPVNPSLLSVFSRLRLSSLAALVVLPFSSVCLSYSWDIDCGGWPWLLVVTACLCGSF